MDVERAASRSSSGEKASLLVTGGSGSLVDVEELQQRAPMESSEPRADELNVEENVTDYRLYKWRFAGVVGIMGLNIVGGMNWPWFGPIANNTASQFGITLDQVNWLGNVISIMYLAAAPVIPILCRRYGLRVCYFIGVVFIILASWVRFAATAKSLNAHGAYALLVLGQLFGSVAQATFQVLAPRFSEKWFDMKGRTTATMLMSISNPIGGALGQLISPLVSTPKKSVLVLGVISTVATPLVFLIWDSPPTPPSYAGSVETPSFFTTVRAMVGKLPPPKENTGTSANAYMSLRERVDFIIVFMIFGVLVGGTNSFSLLSDQLLEPYGYSSDTAGFMGAALLLSGIVAAIITSPLFDRVFTHHLALAARIFTPLIAAAWISLIWAVRPNNAAALYAIFVIIGVFSVTILPVGLELGVELTRNASASSAALWWSGNLWGTVFVLVMQALRASDSASPPFNMHRSLIFQGVFIGVVVSSVLILRGRQARRETDVMMLERSKPSQNLDSQTKVPDDVGQAL
ncbi:MFS general substrate transporter [Schizopora paradoxa]|uniref:MFS general substrate transporter n=1 Tax=Schizopora paradoxa TaxID=27342 RepID=A0A0H2SBV4_9AGAM|nr:MFS general substrate transporter [Schizopora paradoxa]